MGEVIDICQFRRCKRLFSLLVERCGVETFLVGTDDVAFRIDPSRLDDAVGLAAGWLELRTKRQVTSGTRRLMREYLRRELIQALAKYLVETGH